MGGVPVQVTELRRCPVRRLGPSQIKMYGFCRLFRAMFVPELAWSRPGVLGLLQPVAYKLIPVKEEIFAGEKFSYFSVKNVS